MGALSPAQVDKITQNLSNHQYQYIMMPHESIEKGDLKFGDFVVTGPMFGREPAIGYIVQVRKKWGEFGSDSMYIRESDGSMMAHSNQSIWKLNQATTKEILPLFENTPEEEKADNPDLEYSLRGQFKRGGFLIEEEEDISGYR